MEMENEWLRNSSSFPIVIFSGVSEVATLGRGLFENCNTVTMEALGGKVDGSFRQLSTNQYPGNNREHMSREHCSECAVMQCHVMSCDIQLIHDSSYGYCTLLRTMHNAVDSLMV